MIQITSATSPKSFSKINRMIKNKAKRKKTQTQNQQQPQKTSE